MTRSKATQRARLIEGMIAAAARYGYGGASVARVIEQAGVSRATFYEHFDNKEECFLAAYRAISASIGREVERDREMVERPRGIIAGMLAGIERNPAAARLFLLEALAGEASVRDEHEQLLIRVERSIDQYVDEASATVPRYEIPARAVVGGIGNVLAIRTFEGETGRLSSLLDDLMTWLGAYTVPQDDPRFPVDLMQLGRSLCDARGTVEAAEMPQRPLPRGASALSEGIVAGEHRDRVVAATARMTMEKGFRAMTIADIVSAASVTREVFYELFRSKEDAFLAAQAVSLQESLAHAAGEFFKAGEWPERVWNAGMVVLDYIAEHPGQASIQLVEGYAAGPTAIRRTFDSRMAYTLFLEDGYRQRPEAEGLPHLCSEAIAGSVLEIMRQQVLRGSIDRMGEVLPELVYVGIAPFIGPSQAIDLIEAKVAEAQRQAGR